MKPALSLVFFTVLSGAGFGLAVFITLLAGRAGLAQPSQPGGIAFTAAVLLSLALVGGGLGASVLHLANPKNAWRTVMRVRTSWLSREAVLAAMFFPLMALYLFAEGDALHDILRDILRAAIAVIALLTVLCTAMIYQSLKTIPQWHHLGTAFNYLMLALMSGGVMFNFFAAFGASDASSHPAAIVVTLLCTAAGACGKWYHYRRIGKCEDIQVGNATGFSRARARLLDAGHTGATFLTHEFIYHCPAATLRRRRILALTLTFLSPPLALWLPLPLAVAAALAMFAGLLLERWLFFAEARHSVRAYHGNR